MFPGGPTSSAPGDTRDEILGLKASLIAGNVLSAKMTPWSPYRTRYFAPFMNAIYIGHNVKSHFNQDISVQGTIPFSTRVGSIYFEDAGDWSSFDTDFIPSGNAEYLDALTANQIQIAWKGNYELTAPTGDTQLTITSVTGAARGYNVGPVPNRSTRGRLFYTIQTVSGVHIVRFWAINGSFMLLVAEDTTGSLTAMPRNNSGVSVVYTIAYTADVPNNQAWFDLRWNQGFQVHYSTSALAFPRTPEAIVQDTGTDNYVFLSPVIPGGLYNFNVLTINDDGLVQGSAYPTTSPLTVNASPAAPTITSVTGAASGLVVNWDVGEAGCTFTVYSSLKNSPINFESANTPTPITTAIDATTATLAAITDFAVDDFTSDFSTLASAFDTQVSAALTAYAIGESGFITSFGSVQSALDAAISAFGGTLEIDFSEFAGLVNGICTNVLDTATSLDELYLTPLTGWTAAGPYFVGDYTIGLSGGSGDPQIGSAFTIAANPDIYLVTNWDAGANLLDFEPPLIAGVSLGDSINFIAPTFTWSDSMKASMGQFLSGLGCILSGNSARYSFSDGTLPSITPLVVQSIYDAALPLIETAKIRVVIRASKGGVQEQTDAEFVVELDNSGNILFPKPNQANIAKIAVTSGLTLNVVSSVIEDDTAALADSIQLFVVPIASSFNFAAPVDIQSLGTAYGNYHSTTLSYTVGSVGWYKIAVKAVSAGTLSDSYSTQTIYLSTSTPDAVLNLNAKVIRGLGII